MEQVRLRDAETWSFVLWKAQPLGQCGEHMTFRMPLLPITVYSICPGAVSGSVHFEYGKS